MQVFLLDKNLLNKMNIHTFLVSSARTAQVNGLVDVQLNSDLSLSGYCFRNRHSPILKLPRLRKVVPIF